MRGNTSAVPPAGKGTMNLTGLLGWARTARDAAAATTVANSRARGRANSRLIRDGPEKVLPHSVCRGSTFAQSGKRALKPAGLVRAPAPADLLFERLGFARHQPTGHRQNADRDQFSDELRQR